MKPAQRKADRRWGEGTLMIWLEHLQPVCLDVAAQGASTVLWCLSKVELYFWHLCLKEL